MIFKEHYDTCVLKDHESEKNIMRFLCFLNESFRGLHEYQSCLSHSYYTLCAHNTSVEVWDKIHSVAFKRVKHLLDVCSRHEDPLSIGETLFVDVILLSTNM